MPFLVAGGLLGLGGLAQAISGGTKDWYEQARLARQEKLDEQQRAEAINTAKLNQQEIIEDLMQKRREQAEHQQMLQRDQQAKAILPRYLQSVQPEDKEIVQTLVDAAQVGEPGDAAKAIGILNKYFQDKQFTNLANAQAIALKQIQDEFELNKEKSIQEGENKRSQATKEGADARAKLSRDAAWNRQTRQLAEEDKRLTKSTTAKVTGTQQEAIAGLDVLDTALNDMEKNLKPLDEGTWNRYKLGRLSKLDSKEGGGGSILDIQFSKGLSQEDQDFLRSFNAARDSVQALRNFMGKARATQQTYLALARLLPDPVTTTDSKMGQAKIDQLRRLIKTARAQVNQLTPQSLGVAPEASPSSGGVVDWNELPDAPE